MKKSRYTAHFIVQSLSGGLLVRDELFYFCDQKVETSDIESVENHWTREWGTPACVVNVFTSSEEE